MSVNQISNRIRRLRFDANEMTQAELAEKAGVTRQTIISVESGKYCPSLELAFRIALAFGVRIEEVFSYGPLTTEAAYPKKTDAGLIKTIGD
jgi:putative transcriptional regulator